MGVCSLGLGETEPRGETLCPGLDATIAVDEAERVGLADGFTREAAGELGMAVVSGPGFPTHGGRTGSAHDVSKTRSGAPVSFTLDA